MWQLDIEFDSYEFNEENSRRMSIYDVTIADKNREHKHHFFESGIQDFDTNWGQVTHE